MLGQRSARLGLSLVIALSAAGPAWATGDNLKSVKQAYPNAKTISCKTCHQNPVGRATDLNPYGLALQASKGGPGKAKKLTVDDYRAIEKDDADKDGVPAKCLVIALPEFKLDTAFKIKPAVDAAMPVPASPAPAASTTPATSQPATNGPARPDGPRLVPEAERK